MRGVVAATTYTCQCCGARHDSAVAAVACFQGHLQAARSLAVVEVGDRVANARDIWPVLHESYTGAATVIALRNGTDPWREEALVEFDGAADDSARRNGERKWVHLVVQSSADWALNRFRRTVTVVPR